MSNAYAVSSPSSRRAFRRQVWGQIFGEFIRGIRERDGHSAEEAAQLAGMKASEWEAVEAGRSHSRTRNWMHWLRGSRRTVRWWDRS